MSGGEITWARPSRVPTIGWMAWGQAAVVLAVLGALYSGVFASLIRVWWDSDIHRHGFLVPFVTVYLVWCKRHRLFALEPAPRLLTGSVVMVLAATMLIVGKFGAAVLLEELSFLVMIAGLVLMLLGATCLKAVAFPLAYLLFMIPIASEGTDWVHWPFQLLAANISVFVLQGLGFSAFREAQYIELPNITLEVAEGCSGIRFMMSVIAIGIPLAYLTQHTWRRRLGLVAFAVVIGILANSVRVTLIGVLAYYGAPVKGPLHVLQAMFVAWIGYVALVVGAYGLGRWPSR